MRKTTGCYVHIPFCVKKCAYCDFNSYSGYGESLIKRYNAALLQEIASAEFPAEGETVDTVFFGGGTPTAISAADEVAILQAAIRRLNIPTDAEITTEANPGTADIAGLEILRAGGFNRISFGVQSFDAGLLQAIDRIHSADEAKTALRAARAAGFDNLSIDLMFGLPRQTLAQWQDTVRQALELETDHLSIYGLIVEENTGFGIMARKGKLTLPEDDLVADMYAYALEAAAQAGYGQYEISNFAKPGRECRHNIHYWRADDYYGFGAGAAQFRANVRRTNILLPGKYAETVARGDSPDGETEPLDRAALQGEAMMLGLRMTEEGVDVARFRKRFGQLPGEIWLEEVSRFTRLGLLEPTDQNMRLRLTERGVFMANEVMAAFV